MNKIRGVFIYSDYPSDSLKLDGIKEFLQQYGIQSQIRGNVTEFLRLSEDEYLEFARRIAGIRVEEITKPKDNISYSTPLEVDTELKKITGKKNFVKILYDGNWLQRIFYAFMAYKNPWEFVSGYVHLIFTNRLFLTYEGRRYHARVVILGIPSLVSSSGLVEAPARPKEYYWLKAGFIQSGKDISELDPYFSGKYVEYDDHRITSILGAYALQAIFYELNGEPFCKDSNCCLYNSHWQEEVLDVQYQGKLCKEHYEEIDKL